MKSLERSTAATHYAARVDAVIEQRTRFRGPRPPGDLFAGLSPDSTLLRVNPHAPLDPNTQIIASYIEPDDVVIDVGRGAGRVCLPLALRCREVINIEPSFAMAAGFTANASRAEITNARVITDDWLSIDNPPTGTVGLVNHVTYLTREIVAFIERLEKAAPRRILVTVANPPQPSRHGALYQRIHGEQEQGVPGHRELLNVLWELNILPEVRVLPVPFSVPSIGADTREKAIDVAVDRFKSAQWSFWPIAPELDNRLRLILRDHFDEFFRATNGGFIPLWMKPCREILITWESSNRPG